MNHRLLLFIACLYMAPCISAAKEISNFSPKPLSFIENKGQVVDQYGKQRKDIDVKLETPGMNIFIGKGQIHYQWFPGSQPGAGGSHPADPSLRYATLRMTNGRMQNTTSPLPPELFAPLMRPLTLSSKGELQERDIKAYRMDVELIGANKNAEPILEEPQAYYENYYLSQCPEGVTAHSYGKITYKNIYPGIDWVVYSTGGRLKYDFIVSPGADASAIRLRYNGATRLGLKDGALQSTTPMGSITEDVPYSYDMETRTALATAYILEGNEVSFSTAPHSGGGMVIDPYLGWATYYGGGSSEIVTAKYLASACTDRLGNPCLAGVTQSSSNIATTGAFQASIASSPQDGFLVKFNASGVRQWATYYGAASVTTEIFSVCSDAGNNIYIGGEADGNGLGSAGAYRPNYAARGDNLLVKFNSAGQRLWATYYGGGGDDRFGNIYCDAGGVYLGGFTDTSAGLATPGSFQPGYVSGHSNSFLVKFSSAGSRLWATYYPCDEILAIGGYGDSVVYIAGMVTGNYSGVSTSSAHQASFGGGSTDGFMAKFTSNGMRQWGSFLGGSGAASTESIAALATGPAGELYVCGETKSTSGIATPGAFQTSPYFNSECGFINKFSAGGVRQWGSYYYEYTATRGIVTDSSGLVYISGTLLGSVPGFATPGAYQTSFGGSWDAILSIFSPSGSRLWASYYGGSGLESAQWNSIAYGGNRIYMSGITNSSSGIATTGAHQTSYGGNGDAFLAQFVPDGHVYIKDIGGVSQLCKGDSLLVRYGVTIPFQSGNVFTVELSDAAGSFASPTALGTKTGTQADSLKVLIPTSLVNGSGYRIRIRASLPADTSLDLGININIWTNPPKPVATSNSPVCAGDSLKLGVLFITGVTWSWMGPNSFTDNSQNPAIAAAGAAAAGDYIVTANSNGCIRNDTVSVTINPSPAKPVAGNNSPICAGAILNLTANTTTPGVTWAWYGPNGFNSTQQNPTINPAALADSGNYVVTVSLNGCTRSDTTHAEISNVSSIGAYASPNDTFCEGTLATFVAVPFNMGANPQYQWFKNGNPINGATNTLYNTSSYATGDSFYCRMIATGVCSTPLTLFTQGIKITVLPITLQPSITISSNPAQPIPGQPVAFTATSVNGGPNPTYQWRRNGQDMTGAVYANWNANNLAPYDKITCIVFSSDVCATPKTDTSNPIVVNFPTGIKDIGEDGVMLYPNPTNGSFTVRSTQPGRLTISSIDGRKLAEYTLPLGTTELKLPASLSPGIYMGNIKTEDNKSYNIRLIYQP